MKFIDEVTITTISGKGGDGSVSFRREKYIPRGGPDGGNGGKGGAIFFEADEGMNTLSHFRGVNRFKAKDGENGFGSQKDGKSGDDLTITVPVGTIVRNRDSNETIIDFTRHNQRAMISHGGRGGLGNMNFKSSTNQAPRYAQKGAEGSELDLYLELKLIADIALVGLPNAGKSTLISSISNARPKIADYPFTTLEPNLGVVDVGEESVVVADIPGLIEDASQGKGLGHKFLKHIERTKAFIHLIDCALCLEPAEAFENYATIRIELDRFNAGLLNKKEIICLTKTDAMTEEEINRFQDFFEDELQKKVLPISGVSGSNLDKLKELMVKIAKQSEN